MQLIMSCCQQKGTGQVNYSDSVFSCDTQHTGKFSPYFKGQLALLFSSQKLPMLRKKTYFYYAQVLSAPLNNYNHFFLDNID